MLANFVYCSLLVKVNVCAVKICAKNAYSIFLFATKFNVICKYIQDCDYQQSKSRFHVENRTTTTTKNDNIHQCLESNAVKPIVYSDNSVLYMFLLIQLFTCNNIEIPVIPVRNETNRIETKPNQITMHN